MIAKLTGLVDSIGADTLILDVAALVNIVTRAEEDRLLPHRHTPTFNALASNSSAVQSGR